MDLIAQLHPYQPALLALAILSLTVLIQSLLTAPLAFASGEQTPGSPLKGDYSQRSFRVVRTHANSAENLAPFGLAVLLAAIAGSNINLVNGAAAAHVLFRLAFWGVYFAGIGVNAGGPRTLCFIGGLLSNAIIIIAAIAALITGDLL